jgi:hypothetical protein
MPRAISASSRALMRRINAPMAVLLCIALGRPVGTSLVVFLCHAYFESLNVAVLFRPNRALFAAENAGASRTKDDDEA